MSNLWLVVYYLLVIFKKRPIGDLTGVRHTKYMWSKYKNITKHTGAATLHYDSNICVMIYFDKKINAFQLFY